MTLISTLMVWLVRNMIFLFRSPHCMQFLAKSSFGTWLPPKPHGMGYTNSFFLHLYISESIKNNFGHLTLTPKTVPIWVGIRKTFFLHRFALLIQFQAKKFFFILDPPYVGGGCKLIFLCRFTYFLQFLEIIL